MVNKRAGDGGNKTARGTFRYFKTTLTQRFKEPPRFKRNVPILFEFLLSGKKMNFDISLRKKKEKKLRSYFYQSYVPVRLAPIYKLALLNL